MNILQKIFSEHYEEIQYILHPRPVVMENIAKMINCGDPSYGGAMYGCPCCGELKFLPFRCHSKFCPTCGNKYCIDRSTKMSFKLIRCTHRHLVFTIDEDLRLFFLDDRSLLDCLFQAVRSVLLEMFHKLNKSKNFVPGFICVLHSFRNEMKYEYRVVPVQKCVESQLQRTRLVCVAENGQYTSTDTFKFCSGVIHKELQLAFDYHSLRHTHATLLIEAGANVKNVQTRLGHSNITTTLQTYVHDTEKMAEQSVELFERVTTIKTL